MPRKRGLTALAKRAVYHAPMSSSASNDNGFPRRYRYIRHRDIKENREEKMRGKQQLGLESGTMVFVLVHVCSSAYYTIG